MSDFIEGLSSSMLANLDKANNKLNDMIRNVNTLNTAMSNITLPSQNDAEIRRLNAELQRQTQIIADLQRQLTSLANARQQNNQRTSEEIVNQRTLAQNADRQARATSALVGAYANLNAQHQIASRRLQDLIVRGRTAEQTQRQYNRELANARREFQQLDTRVQSADRAVGRFNRNVGNYPRQALGFMKDLLGAFGLAGGITLFATMAKDAFATVKELQSLNMALLQVTGSQEQMAKSQSFLADISEKYGVEIKDLTKMFTQFYVSAKDKMAGKDIENIFESITKAGASMGLSQENMQRAFLAMNQIMAKGAVQAEELKGQLSEALPGALGIMAKSLGVTEKKLMDMMKAGEVSSDALIGFAKQLEKTYGIENVERIDNIVNAQNRLSNSWTALIKTFSENEGFFSKGVKGLINSFAMRLDIVTEGLKSEEQKRQDYLNFLQETGTNQAEDEVEILRANGAKKEELEAEINKKLTKHRKDQSEAYINAKKLEANILASWDEKQRKKDMVSLAKLNNELRYRAGLIKGFEQYITPQRETEGETESQRKARLKAEEERLKQLYENRKKELELELFVIDQTLENDATLYATREMALEAHRLKRMEIIGLQYKEELRLAKGAQGKEQEALLNYHKSQLVLMEEILKFSEAIAKARLQPIDAKELAKPEEELAKSAKLATDELEKQNDALNKTKENLTEIDKKVADYLKGFQEQFFGNAGFETLFDVLNGEIIGFGENWKTTFVAMAEIAQEAFAFISQASNRNFQNEYDNLARQKEIALLFAGESATARAEIEKQYEEKQKQIQRREARAKKAQALFEIGIDTAQAIVAALPNIPLSITIGAIGAIQAGIVASQKIPEYWQGTENHAGGLMKINDRGLGQELVITPDGKGTIFKGKDVIVNAPKGTKVKSARETMEMLMFDRSLNSMLTDNAISMPKMEFNNNNKDVEREIRNLNNTVANKEGVVINFDKNGVRTYLRNGHSLKEIENKRFTGVGSSV